jgi:malate dehydrogenase
MPRKKITVVGAGNVGATTAHLLALKQLGDVVLVDIVKDMPRGKALDLMESRPIEGLEINLTGTNSYGPTRNSDLVIITAGIPRKPGMSRDDLLEINAQIIKTCTEKAVRYSPHSIIIVVSNPLDAMVHVAAEVSRFSKHRVMGMAGVLDTSRFRCFIAMELGCAVEDVSALVLGGHGDTMVPLVRYASVSGIPITELLPRKKIESIVQRTRDAGEEIVKLLKTGSAYYSPASAAVEMAESILKDKKRILPACAFLNGEYGVRGYFVGVPVMLSAKGVEKVIQVKLDPDERAAFRKSVQHVKSLVKKVKI